MSVNLDFTTFDPSNTAESPAKLAKLMRTLHRSTGSEQQDSETGQPVFVSEARDTVRLYGPISILSVNKEGVATLYMVHGLMKTEKPEVAAVEGAEKVEDGAEKGDKGEEGTEKDEEETERAGVTEQGQVTEEMEEMAEAQVSFGTLEQGVLTTAGEQKFRKLLAKAGVA